MKLLVVEDESKTGEYLRQGLTEAGFVVDLVANGLDGQHLAMTEPYDLVILDVMLPDRDGWSVLSEMRRAGNRTPVLYLTARDSVHDRVKGLQLGAGLAMVPMMLHSMFDFALHMPGNAMWFASLAGVLFHQGADERSPPSGRTRFREALREPAGDPALGAIIER